MNLPLNVIFSLDALSPVTVVSLCLQKIGGHQVSVCLCCLMSWIQRCYMYWHYARVKLVRDIVEDINPLKH